jgi:hypothetical protein
MKSLIMAGLLGAGAGVLAAAPDPVFDVAALAAAPLEASLTKSSEADGIVTEEVRFFSEMDGTNRVEIFALVCYPKGARKLPALIWNQSGMSPAAPYFPLLIAKRGYVGMSIDFPQAGYRSSGGYSINSGLTVGDDPRQAPIAHGVVALIRAVSYLQARPEADPDRIGMCGSSWGGFFTTLAMGVDPRLKAGSAMFGCGRLQDGCTWFFDSGTPPDDATLERWGRTLDPAFRLKDLTRPMAWFSGSNDHFFWLNALLGSYERVAGPKHLALVPNFDHGLPPEQDDQVFGWLDTHLKGAPPLIRVGRPRVEVEKGQRLFRWDWSSASRQAKRAEIAYSYGKPGNWKTRYWIVQPAILGTNGVCEAALPARDFPLMAFGTVFETNGYRSSTTAIEVSALAGGAPLDAGAYNGCGMWGGFEESDVAWLTLMGLMKTVVTNDAHSGRQAVVIGKAVRMTTSVYYVAGVPSRFSVFVKSEQPSSLKVTLNGKFDGKAQVWTAETATGPGWTELVIPLTPPDCKAPHLGVTFECGPAPVIIDDVSLTCNPGL